MVHRRGVHLHLEGLRGVKTVLDLGLLLGPGGGRVSLGGGGRGLLGLDGLGLPLVLGVLLLVFGLNLGLEKVVNQIKASKQNGNQVRD